MRAVLQKVKNEFRSQNSAIELGYSRTSLLYYQGACFTWNVGDQCLDPKRVNSIRRVSSSFTKEAWVARHVST